MAAFSLTSVFGGGASPSYDWMSLGTPVNTNAVDPYANVAKGDWFSYGTPMGGTPDTSAAASGADWGMVGGIISAVGGMVTGYYASRVQKAQARMQRNLAEFNQRQAERNAQLALMQSAQRIGQISRKYEGVKSSQKAAMAANGIVLGVGSAAEVTTTTDIDKEQSLQNERMNGMREAWGYRMQGLGYGQQAASANSVAQQADSLAPAISTGLTSGLNAYTNYLMVNKTSVTNL